MTDKATAKLLARTSLAQLRLVVNASDDADLGRYMYAEMKRLAHLLRVKHKFPLKKVKNDVNLLARAAQPN